MGKGDKKTKRGKISIGSYGKVRKRKSPKIAPTKKKIKPQKTAPMMEAEKVVTVAAKKTTTTKTTTKTAKK